jgi:hypothetical protein
MFSRYYAMSENVWRGGSGECKKENPDFGRREKNEEIISRNCLPHHKKAGTFFSTHKATNPIEFALNVVGILSNE